MFDYASLDPTPSYRFLTLEVVKSMGLVRGCGGNNQRNFFRQGYELGPLKIGLMISLVEIARVVSSF